MSKKQVIEPVEDQFVGSENRSAICAELVSIVQKYGHLTAATVLEEASRPDSILHDQFEWDDSRAAEGFRIGQALGLIRRYRVVVRLDNGERVEARRFVLMRGEDDVRGRYIPFERAVDDGGLGELVNRAVAELSAFERKNSDLLRIVDGVQPLIEETKQRLLTAGTAKRSIAKAG